MNLTNQQKGILMIVVLLIAIAGLISYTEKLWWLGPSIITILIAFTWYIITAVNLILRKRK